MFHMMANTLATGGAVTLADVPAVSDGQFSIRNGHFIFSESYRLLGAAAFGATLTALQLTAPHVAYINPHQVYPGNLSVTIPANVQVQDLRDTPFPVPQEEEISWQASDSASEQVQLFTWLGTDGWSRQLPRGIAVTTALFTASYVGVANAWGADTSLVQATTLRGGTYAILGAYCQRTNGLAFRLNFTRSPMYGSRKLLPGDLCSNTYSAVPNKLGQNWLGNWGYFNTFEFPLLEMFCTAAATATATLWLQLAYMSERTDALDGYVRMAA